MQLVSNLPALGSTPNSVIVIPVKTMLSAKMAGTASSATAQALATGGEHVNGVSSEFRKRFYPELNVVCVVF